MKDDILKEISEREEQVKELMKDAEGASLQNYKEILKELEDIRKDELRIQKQFQEFDNIVKTAELKPFSLYFLC